MNYSDTIGINNLSDDLLISLCKYLSPSDIYILRNVNRLLYTRLGKLSDFIVTEQLTRYTPSITKHDMYILTTIFLKECYLRTLKNISASALDKISQGSGSGNTGSIDFALTKYETEIRKYMTDINYWESFSVIPYINTLFKRIYLFFQKHDTLINYTDKLDIFLFYNIIQIVKFRSTRNATWNVRFIYDFANRNNSFVMIAHDYFKYLLDTFYSSTSTTTVGVLHLDTLHLISHYSVNIRVLKKLFGYKQLDLRYTHLIECCRECEDDNLYQIVFYKFNRPDDELLSHNYILIKSLLQSYNWNMYLRIKEYELSLVNRHVRYRHPTTGEYIRLKSITSQRLLFNLKYESPYKTQELSAIEKQILRHQVQLVSHYFT